MNCFSSVKILVTFIFVLINASQAMAAPAEVAPASSKTRNLLSKLGFGNKHTQNNTPKIEKEPAVLSAPDGNDKLSLDRAKNGLKYYSIAAQGERTLFYKDLPAPLDLKAQAQGGKLISESAPVASPTRGQTNVQAPLVSPAPAPLDENANLIEILLRRAERLKEWPAQQAAVLNKIIALESDFKKEIAEIQKPRLTSKDIGLNKIVKSHPSDEDLLRVASLDANIQVIKRIKKGEYQAVLKDFSDRGSSWSEFVNTYKLAITLNQPQLVFDKYLKAPFNEVTQISPKRKKKQSGTVLAANSDDGVIASVIAAQ